MSDIPNLAHPARKLARQGLDSYQVANQLFDHNDPIRSSHAVALALNSPLGLNLSFPRVANVLHHEKGLGLPPETVATVLSSPSGLNIAEAGLAWAFHREEGLGLPLETVAKVLHHKEGVNLSPTRIAKALTHEYGLALPPHKLVPVLATITASDEALFEATVPLLRSRYHRPEQHLALMDALLHHLPTERSLPLLAKAVLAGELPLYSPAGLARFFAAKDGLELPPQSIVYALTHHAGPRLAPEQVAPILTSETGLGLPPHAAAEALACGAALDPHQARRIVGDCMDSAHVPMLQRDEDDPPLASPVSTHSLAM